MKAKICKRSLILIEMLIALALFSMMATFLFFGFHLVTGNSKTNMETQRLESKIGSTYQALSRVFSSVSLEREGNAFACFYKAEGSDELILTFDNGPDRDPHYSSRVLAKLFVDEAHQLCLVLWPLPGKWPLNQSLSRKEILLNQVNRISFSFYYPQDTTSLEVQPKKMDLGQERPRPPSGLQSEWLLAYQDIPYILKLQIHQAESVNPISMSFLMSPAKKAIKVKQRGI